MPSPHIHQTTFPPPNPLDPPPALRGGLNVPTYERRVAIPLPHECYAAITRSYPTAELLEEALMRATPTIEDVDAARNIVYTTTPYRVNVNPPGVYLDRVYVYSRRGLIDMRANPLTRTQWVQAGLMSLARPEIPAFLLRPWLGRATHPMRRRSINVTLHASIWEAVDEAAARHAVPSSLMVAIALTEAPLPSFALTQAWDRLLVRVAAEKSALARNARKLAALDPSMPAPVSEYVTRSVDIRGTVVNWLHDMAQKLDVARPAIVSAMIHQKYAGRADQPYPAAPPVDAQNAAQSPPGGLPDLSDPALAHPMPAPAPEDEGTLAPATPRAATTAHVDQLVDEHEERA